MNGRKWSTSWALAWGLFILVGGMIIYSGYSGKLYSSLPERTSDETVEALSAYPSQALETEGTALVPQIQTVKSINEDQEIILVSSEKNLAIPREKNLKDFPCPVKGQVLRSIGNYYCEAFNTYLFHAGIDFAEPEGTIIRTTYGGKVIYSGADPLLGQKVTLDCGDGWIITYGGLDNLRVEIGQTVGTQDALGQVGLSTIVESESDQPHLHYEVWHRDEVQRPQ